MCVLLVVPGKHRIVLHVVDLVTGVHLSGKTAFGYSPTIGIRFVGEGNLTFSQLAAAAVLFVGLLVWQVPNVLRVRESVLAVLAVTVVVMGVPGPGSTTSAPSSPRSRASDCSGGCCSASVCVCTVAAIASIVVAAVVAVGPARSPALA